MTDLSKCCSRTTTSVGIERDGVQLRSCPSCGQHAWTRDGRRLDREALLDALRAAPAPRATPRPSARAAQAPAEHSHLRSLLTGFTPHGSSS